MEDLSEGLGQVLVSDRIGSTEVHWTGNFGMFYEERKGLGQILDVNPRKPLFAATDGSTDKLLEERNHLPQGSSLFS